MFCVRQDRLPISLVLGSVPNAPQAPIRLPLEPPNVLRVLRVSTFQRVERAHVFHAPRVLRIRSWDSHFVDFVAQARSPLIVLVAVKTAVLVVPPARATLSAPRAAQRPLRNFRVHLRAPIVPPVKRRQRPRDLVLHVTPMPTRGTMWMRKEIVYPAPLAPTTFPIRAYVIRAGLERGALRPPLRVQLFQPAAFPCRRRVAIRAVPPDTLVRLELLHAHCVTSYLLRHMQAVRPARHARLGKSQRIPGGPVASVFRKDITRMQEAHVALAQQALTWILRMAFASRAVRGALVEMLAWYALPVRVGRSSRLQVGQSALHAPMDLFRQSRAESLATCVVPASISSRRMHLAMRVLLGPLAPLLDRLNHASNVTIDFFARWPPRFRSRQPKSHFFKTSTFAMESRPGKLAPTLTKLDCCRETFGRLQRELLSLQVFVVDLFS